MPHWTDAPPTPEELKAAQAATAAPSWDSEPPKPHELAAISGGGEDGQVTLPGVGAMAKGGVGESIGTNLEHAANFLTAGHLPHIGARITRGIGKLALNDDAYKQLPSYEQLRDENIANYNKRQERNPGSALAGDAEGFIAGAVLPGQALGKAAEGAGAMGKIGQATAQGFGSGMLQNPGDKPGAEASLQLGDRFSNGLSGAAFSGGLQAASSATSALGNWLLGKGKDVSGSMARIKTPGAQDAYIADPKGVTAMGKQLNGGDVKGLSDVANAKAQEALQALKQKGGEEGDALKQLLTGKQIEISPMQMKGISPEVDDLLQRQANKRVYSDLPSTLKINAEDAIPMKQGLDKAAKFRKSALYSDAESAAKQNAAKASQPLRDAIYGLGGEPNLNAQQRTIKLGSAFRQAAERDPLKATTASVPSKIGMMQEIDQLTGGKVGLKQFGDKMAAAKSFLPAGEKHTFKEQLIKPIGRLGLRGAGAIESTGDAMSKALKKIGLAPDAVSPTTRQALLNLFVRSNDDEQK